MSTITGIPAGSATLRDPYDQPDDTPIPLSLIVTNTNSKRSL